jgi:hypothetical protein
MFPSVIIATINKYTSCITVLHRWNAAARKHPVDEENDPHCKRGEDHWTRRCRVATPVGTKVFSSLKHPLRLWGLTQPPIQWVPGSFPGGKAAGLRLTSRLFLVAGLRWSGTITVHPLHALMVSTGTTLLFHFPKSERHASEGNVAISSFLCSSITFQRL